MVILLPTIDDFIYFCFLRIPSEWAYILAYEPFPLVISRYLFISILSSISSECKLFAGRDFIVL